MPAFAGPIVHHLGQSVEVASASPLHLHQQVLVLLADSVALGFFCLLLLGRLHHVDPALCGDRVLRLGFGQLLVCFDDGRLAPAEVVRRI